MTDLPTPYEWIVLQVAEAMMHADASGDDFERMATAAIERLRELGQLCGDDD